MTSRLSTGTGTGRGPEKTHYIAQTTFTLPAESGYADLRPLGKGSYGVVVSAWCERRQRKVAIKKITPVAKHVIDAKHVLREVRLLRYMGQHENIITLEDLHYREAHDEIYVVLELMDSDLHRIIQSKQVLSEQHFAFFMFQLLAGVRYLHMNRIIHRDLKPGNLLVSKDCQLRITDFGLAREKPQGREGEREEEMDEPMTEHVVTRWYRPPELMLCPDGLYDYSVDMWSCGCILGEMLRRDPLFPGKNFLDQLSLVFDAIGAPAAEEVQHIVNAEARKFLRSQGHKKNVPWRRTFPAASAEALELLNALLVFAPEKRVSAEQALFDFAFVRAFHSPQNAMYNARCLEWPTVDPAQCEFSFEREKTLTRRQAQQLIIKEAQSFRRERAIAARREREIETERKKEEEKEKEREREKRREEGKEKETEKEKRPIGSQPTHKNKDDDSTTHVSHTTERSHTTLNKSQRASSTKRPTNGNIAQNEPLAGTRRGSSVRSSSAPRARPTHAQTNTATTRSHNTQTHTQTHTDTHTQAHTQTLTQAQAQTRTQTRASAAASEREIRDAIDIAHSLCAAPHNAPTQPHTTHTAAHTPPEKAAPVSVPVSVAVKALAERETERGSDNESEEDLLTLRERRRRESLTQSLSQSNTPKRTFTHPQPHPQPHSHTPAQTPPRASQLSPHNTPPHSTQSHNTQSHNTPPHNTFPERLQKEFERISHSSPAASPQRLLHSTRASHTAAAHTTQPLSPPRPPQQTTDFDVECNFTNYTIEQRKMDFGAVEGASPRKTLLETYTSPRRISTANTNAWDVKGKGLAPFSPSRPVSERVPVSVGDRDRDREEDEEMAEKERNFLSRSRERALRESISRTQTRTQPHMLAHTLTHRERESETESDEDLATLRRSGAYSHTTRPSRVFDNDERPTHTATHAHYTQAYSSKLAAAAANTSSAVPPPPMERQTDRARERVSAEEMREKEREAVREREREKDREREREREKRRKLTVPKSPKFSKMSWQRNREAENERMQAAAGVAEKKRATSTGRLRF